MRLSVTNIRTVMLVCLLPLTLLATVSAHAGSIVIEALFDGMAVVNLDGKRITLKKGATARAGMRLISANSYEAVIEYQGKRKTYRPGGQPVSSQYAKPAAQESVRILPDDRGLYITRASINGVETEVMIDTGASVVAMNEQHARSLGIDAKREGTKVQVETASTKMHGYEIKLRQVQLGPIVVSNIRAVVLLGDLPSQVLLGASFLDHVDLQRKKSVILLKTKSF